MKQLSYSLLLFLFVFNIPVYGVLGTGYLSSIIVFIIIFSSSRYINDLQKLLREKIIYIIMLAYLLFFVVSITSTILHQEYDFTIQKTIINGFIAFLASILFSSLYFSCFKFKHDLI